MDLQGGRIMDQNLKNKCDLVIENRNILKKKMMW